MSTISSSAPLASMLNNAFTQLDVDKNKSLDRREFKSFYEFLKPGIPADQNGHYKVSEEAEFRRMDHDGNGAVTCDEMQSTGVLMPADLCDESLNAMIKHLLQKGTSDAAYAAELLQTPDALNSDAADKAQGA